MEFSNPYVKSDPDGCFASNSNPRHISSNAFSSQLFGTPNLDQNSLTNNYITSYQNSYGPSSNRSGGGFNDDELLDSLASRDMQLNNPLIDDMGRNSGSIDQFCFNSNLYDHNNNTSLSLENNIYSSRPDADSLASPYLQNFNQAQNRVSSHNFGTSLHSPTSFTESPILPSNINGQNPRNHPSFLSQGIKIGISDAKGHNLRSPLTPKTPALSSLQIGSAETGSGFVTRPIRTASAHGHQKSSSAQWGQTSSSFNSFGGDFSPIRSGQLNTQISDILRGTSMPVKSNSTLQNPSNGLQSQEMKRRRRRESHNLVERRRRDNINERIQELSHLVPLHRLEDEKVRKALQSNSPLSPILAGASAPTTGLSPSQATSGLAGHGARRAAAGNITTGIPVEEKDKGPNKGDILNGAVSWTRDLMWMLHLKFQQQEELVNYIAELGGTFPFQPSEDEKRMQTELMDAICKNNVDKFHYSRAPGSGLRVPKHTDLKGDPISSTSHSEKVESLSPDNQTQNDPAQANMHTSSMYWNELNSVHSGNGSISFKEDSEFCMDLTQ
ncbi:putative helix-loop-helix dna-binding domain-containing protein [Erysiphe neolycopersici]|uniref:Putative helix-loop-helix dna-binding domain-containing protein n=1 Tax=Erysiphe neolycopersici TaxID=212602 RepID=A0A420HTC3_9PEZI|nr:putative helix-loop-helix dna-binding domain-containing protein [Erysiphe neolycopersici]